MISRQYFIICILPLLCTACPVGKYEVSGGGCSGNCMSSCTTCVDATTCESCSGANQFLSPSKTCTNCPTGCVTCNSNSCLSCTTGYYLSTLCIQCPTPCSLCSSSTICSACNSGYYLSGSSCLSCTLPSIICGSPCTCSSGYYLNGSCCYPCQAPCSECSGSATSCTSCVDPTNQSISTCDCNLPNKYLDSTNGYQCSNCVSPCLNCSSASICDSCINGYVLSGSTCVLCTKPCVNCITNQTTCQTCNDSANQTPSSCNCNSGFIMNLSTFMCDQCNHPCATCQNTINECYSCASTYQYDSSAHTCSCLTNQYEDNATPKACQNCSSPCLTCSSTSNNCNSCIIGLNRHLSVNSCVCNDGYYENGGVCTLCSLPCTKCTSSTVCTECNDISHQVLNDCHCIDTYYMDASFVCQSCISPCLYCSSSSDCTSCIDNYYLNTNSCLQCSLPCYNCVDTDTKCTSCAHANQSVSSDQCICDDGYYMDASYYCQLCTHPCSKCTNTSTYCTDCASTFISSGSNTCICSDGYYEETANSPSDCQICTSPCSKCEITSTHCLTCVDANQTVDASTFQCLCNLGWIANGNYCDQCVSPCTQCSGTTTYCTACKDTHHQIISGQCICESGWLNDANYDCQPCIQPCDSCSFNTNHCDSCVDINHIINSSYQCICQDTYYSDTISHCAPCVQPCANCDSNGCLTCIDANQYIDTNLDCVCTNGYYMDTINCLLCQLPCVYCTSSLDCLTCIDANQTVVNDRCICNDGYYSNGNYCNSCQLPCTKCITTQNTCTECVDPNHLIINNSCICKSGYGQSGLNGNYCSMCQYPCLECSISVNTCTKCADTNLFKLNNNQCECLDGFYKSNNQCLVCAPQCKTCNSFSDYCLICKDSTFVLINNQCSCNPGYFLNNQANCIACMEYCQKCNDQFSCETCQDGYYYESMQCNKCSNNCKTCQNQNDFCLSCNNNYNLINNQCICGFGYYEQNDICQKCKYPCLKCTNEITCLQCAQIQKLSLSDQQTCICQDGFYWSISQCSLCHQNCLTCLDTSTKCLSCDLSLNKILNNNECICAPNYYLSDTYTCITCDSEQGKVIQSCKYKNCNDQVWTYGEDCDDGNKVLGDGCSNCKIDKNYVCANTIMQKSICQQCPQFCISCQLNSITNLSECLKCNSGYYLDQNQCQICDKICKGCQFNPQNCTSCRFISSQSKKCKLCEYKQGYYSDYSTDTCYSKCGDSILADSEQCDDGNQINGDGCNNKCIMEKNVICQHDTCITPNYPIPKLLIVGNPKIYENERRFKLEYNVAIHIIDSSFDLSTQVKFYIENRSGDLQLLNYPFTFIQNMTLVENSNYYYEAIITLNLNQSSQYEILNIYFLDPSQIQSYQEYKQIIDHIKAAINEYIFIDETTQSVTETFSSLSIHLFYIILILLVVSILFGGLDIFYNLLDTIQLLSYLKYINLQYPYNLQMYFEIFGFAQLSFIQNYLNIDDFFSNYVSQEQLKPLPKKIQDDNFTSIYLVNVSQILAVYGMLFGIYSISYIIPLTIKQIRFKYYEDNPEKETFTLKLKIYFLSIKIFIGEMCNKIVNELFYSGILRTFMSTAYDYSFLMLLQIYSIDISSNSPIITLSSLMALSAVFLYIFICLLIIYLLRKHKLSLLQKQNTEKFGSIVEGIKLKNNYQKYFNVVILAKKFIFMVILIFCYEDPLCQTVNLFLLSIITSLYLYLHKPNEDQNEYQKQLSTEVILCLTYLFLVILIVNDQIKKLNNQEQSYIGWICITLITSIILIQLLIDIIQQWRMLLKKFVTLRKFINKIQNMFQKKKTEKTKPYQNIFEEIQNHQFSQSIILYK